MVKKIPKTLRDVISEEPERFISYLDIDKIAKSKNPYEEFLSQFSEAFGKRQGLNLWQYLQNRYNLLNELFKNKVIQDKIDEEFKGSLRRQEAKDFFDEYEKKVEKKQKKREKKIKKTIEVESYQRDGKTISGHSKTKSHTYNQRQERFILSRKDASTRRLTSEFNRAFDTSVTHLAIRDKRLRLQGRK